MFSVLLSHNLDPGIRQEYWTPAYRRGDASLREYAVYP
jgi:hypothetical protein